jgi:hypothetical protein
VEKRKNGVWGASKSEDVVARKIMSVRRQIFIILNIT